MKKLFVWLFLFTCTAAQAQELWQLGRYDEISGGPQGHATQILQDQSGLLWISTWNGLCRFDGYEFRQIKPQAGDGSPMTSDRIRDIWLADNGDIFCKDDQQVYRFSLKTYQFDSLRSQAERDEAQKARQKQTTRGHFVDGNIVYIDPQGLEWQLRDNALFCMSRIERPQQPLDMALPAMVRCMAKDKKGHIWLATKQDATLRLLDANGELLGYMGPTGMLSHSYQQFGHSVYCMTQTQTGDIWLGSKPDGLFRLRENSAGGFSVEHIDGLQCTAVYDIAEDDLNRLWIATLGGGVAVVEQPQADKPIISNHLPGYPKDKSLNTRFIHITPQGVLLAATTEGLVAAQLQRKTTDMVFRRHTREPGRPTSLSCNATMDIVQNQQGQIFVSTETGGVCQILSDDLTADTLSFRHYNTEWGLTTDMAIAMTLADNRLLVSSTTQLMLIDTYRGTCESFGNLFFHHPYYFSESQPLQLADGRWLFATQEGAFFLPQSLMHKNDYVPPLVLTGISVQNGMQNLAVEDLDTLQLKPSERNVTIHFAALDYTAPQAISYQFRLGHDSTAWHNIGHDHSVTLLDLKPGTYVLTLRSTNADGRWTQNYRQLTIIAEPTFWETPWAVLLYVLLAAALLGIAAYTFLYIKRIDRQRQDTLEKYLALINATPVAPQPQHDAPASRPVAPTVKPVAAENMLEQLPFAQQLLSFVESNMGNSDADVAQMAEACAVSRSVLERKMKSLMGITPADFLREARLKQARQLLRNSDMTVSEIAFSCGFSDPKYFSRCFRQSAGMSPTDYKNSVERN